MARRSTLSRFMGFALSFFLAGSLLGSLAQPVSAATYTVDTPVDDGSLNVCSPAPGDCSLRGAITRVNLGSGGDWIYLPENGIFELTRTGRNEDQNVSGDLDLRKTMYIQGRNSTINALGNDRVLDIHAGSVQISDIKITGGQTADGSGPGSHGEPGGGIRITGSGYLNLIHSEVYGNRTGNGMPGASWPAGNGGKGGNGGDGGGIYMTGNTLLLQAVSIYFNHTGRGGQGGEGEPGSEDPYENGGTGAPGGNGGDGGRGGGIYTTTSLSLNDSLVALNTTGPGGAGGTGGSGGMADSTHEGGVGGVGGSGGEGGSGSGLYAVAGQQIFTIARSTVFVNQVGESGAGGQGGAGGDGYIAGWGGNGGPGGRGGAGGGLFLGGGVWVHNSTISENRSGRGALGGAGGWGGQGPYSSGENGIPGASSSGGDGAGIYMENATVRLAFSTILFNDAGESPLSENLARGGGIANFSTLRLATSVIADNTVPGQALASPSPDCFNDSGQEGSIESQGTSVIQNPAGCAVFYPESVTTTDQQYANLKLGELAAMEPGGIVMGYLPATSSPLVERVPCADGYGSYAYDLFYLPRRSGRMCDIGALELQLSETFLPALTRP